MQHFLRLLAAVAAAVLLLSARTALAEGAPIRVGDTIEIRLSGVPAEEISQFSAPYTIDDGGNVNLPFIGMMKLGGLQVAQAQAAIENKLKADKIYSNPTVTINLPQATRFVLVGGQVRAPGRIAYSSDLTLMSAITAAGGFTEFANKKRVTLTRNSKVEEVDCRKLIEHPEKDPKVLPGDQINVPQSLF